jgi:hypothetical protein
MMPLVIIGGVILVPLVLMTVLRINAAIVFLSLCLGGVLVQLIGGDASQFMNLFSGSKDFSHNTAALALIILPTVFTMCVMIKTVRGKVGLVLNILPAAAVGVLALLLIEPFLSVNLRHSITGTKEWHNLHDLQALILSVSAVISLIFLWIQRPKHGKGEEGKKHKGHH